MGAAAAGGRRMRGGAGGVGTAAKPEMLRQEFPSALSPCQLIRVLGTTEQDLHHFSIPVATSGPDRPQQLSTICTFTHRRHMHPRPPWRVLMKGKCDRLSVSASLSV